MSRNMSRVNNRGIIVTENETNVATPTYRSWQHAEDSEAFAVGQRGGVDVSEADIAYRNNAKYYAQSAAASADAAAASAASITGIIATVAEVETYLGL